MSRLSTGGRGVAKIARERTEGTEVDSVVSYKLPDPETRLAIQSFLEILFAPASSVFQLFIKPSVLSNF